MRWFVSAIAAMFAAAGLVGSVAGSEELKVLVPLSLRNLYNDGGVTGVVHETPALFGIPPYQTGVVGRVFYSIPPDACASLNATAIIGSRPIGTNILFVDRGTCSFTAKVRNAGDAGFQSVIVADNQADGTLPYMADDGTKPTPTTPSVLISQADAAPFRDLLVNRTPVTVSITYALPRPDNRVEWDLYTTAVDTTAADFKHNFETSVLVLANNSLFTPHMYTYDGVAIGCTYGGGLTCGNQCSNGGRYCSMDPERNLTSGLSGRDVVQENVRQLCLNDALNLTNSPQHLWFRYVTKFDERCSLPCPQSGPVGPNDPDPSCANGFSYVCSYAVMDALKLPTSLVQKCVNRSGGTEALDGVNSILEKQLKDVVDAAIFFVPTLTINMQPYHGSLQCAIPTDLGNCGPLSAICAGFSPTAVPQACMTTVGCDVGQVRDGCGVCGGNSQRDACEQCLPLTSPNFNQSCRGCDGVINSGMKNDACGVCGGPGLRMNSCLSTGSIVAIVIVSILVAVAIGVGIWWYLRRQSQAMREDVDSLLKQYLPLQENAQTPAGVASSTKVATSDDVNDI